MIIKDVSKIDFFEMGEYKREKIQTLIAILISLNKTFEIEYYTPPEDDRITFYAIDEITKERSKANINCYYNGSPIEEWMYLNYISQHGGYETISTPNSFEINELFK